MSLPTVRHEPNIKRKYLSNRNRERPFLDHSIFQLSSQVTDNSIGYDQKRDITTNEHGANSSQMSDIVGLGSAVSQLAIVEASRGNSESSQIHQNIAEYHNQSKLSLENRLTRISVGIVSLFIICHIWRLIPTAYEAYKHWFSEDGPVLSDWPEWLTHVYHLSHTLIVFNSAVNFLLYVVK